jgi:hypothetical protein
VLLTDCPALERRLAGDRWSTIADSLGLTIEGARQRAHREGERVLDRLVFAFTLGEVPSLEVESPEDWPLVLSHLRWTVAQLADRGTLVDVRAVDTPHGGTALFLVPLEDTAT